MHGSIVRAAMVVLLLATTAPTVEARTISATLDGRAIGIGQVGALACHDLEFPIIRCYDSVAQLDAVVAADRPAARLATGGGYVVVYQNSAYGGSNPKVLTTDVPWLSDIGWNDRISSFKSFGATGEFYEHSPSGGFIYFYGPTTQVAYVGDFYNDKFSSFYID